MKQRAMSGISSYAGGREAAAAPASADNRRADCGRAIVVDRRHRWMATPRAVKTTTIKASKKARAMRATRARATRAIMEFFFKGGGRQ
jgi:hypothetical protein